MKEKRFSIPSVIQTAGPFEEAAKPVKPAKKAGTYRFNARFSDEQGQYLKEMAWRNRCSVTELLSQIVDEHKTRHPEWKERL